VSVDPSQSQIKRRINSFFYAFQGWWYVLRSQPNTWIHAVMTIAVVVLALWLHISWQGWAILVLTFMVVWMAEFMNTALEALVDLVSPEFHPQAKVAKDVAAAAVLVGACGAVIIGLLILGPPLWAKVCALGSLPYCA
jgi:diacylglycerol kinase